MASPSSQASTAVLSQSQGKQPSEQELQTLINDTVVFILCQDYNKHPLKRQDIVKNCLKHFGKLFKTVIDNVKSELKQVYGMDLVEVETTANNKVYMLINPLKMTHHVEDMKLLEEVEAQQVLLMLVLSNIFMSGGVVREDQMWKFLTKLHAIGEKKVHEYFGDVRKLLTVEFVRQMYLEHNRVPDTDPAKYEFRWGQRAEEEVSHHEILKFVSKMHGIDSINLWTTHYKEMKRAEAKKGRIVDGSNDTVDIRDEGNNADDNNCDNDDSDDDC